VQFTLFGIALESRDVHVGWLVTCPTHVDSHCDVSTQPDDTTTGHW
jgi:hypothetical protein